MRIFNSADGDPMLLDSVAGLRSLQERIAVFVESPEREIAFPAETSGSPAPYSEFLMGLRLAKSVGESQLVFTADRWLEQSGSERVLSEFLQQFRVEEDGDHHHWYSFPLSLIIEADESWSGGRNES